MHQTRSVTDCQSLHLPQLLSFFYNEVGLLWWVAEL
jgi:hypothetical protein